LGWMQSTGQASTHNSSLVQVSVITYAMPLRVQFRGQPPISLNGRKHDVYLCTPGPVGG
jgi:hypothetical protein